MKFFTVNIALFVAIWAALFVQSESRCNQACTRIFKPVCAELLRFGRNPMCTFSNLCMLERHRCNNPQQRWIVRDVGSCKVQSLACKELTRS